MRLVIAGKVDPVDRQYYEHRVRPLIDGKQIQYVGEADGPRKRELYRRASCVILPILWEEPFGLVMPEAMACGTPVIVFNRGAASEIVADGITGYVVNDIDEMVAAVKKLDRIDPCQCRRHVEQHFDAPRMVDDYLKLYEIILSSR
jgi:glycosyltransferase involved in cell wall biosynthesis